MRDVVNGPHPQVKGKLFKAPDVLVRSLSTPLLKMSKSNLWNNIGSSLGIIYALKFLLGRILLRNWCWDARVAAFSFQRSLTKAQPGQNLYIIISKGQQYTLNRIILFLELFAITNLRCERNAVLTCRPLPLKTSSASTSLVFASWLLGIPGTEGIRTHVGYWDSMGLRPISDLSINKIKFQNNTHGRVTLESYDYIQIHFTGPTSSLKCAPRKTQLHVSMVTSIHVGV